MPEEDEDAFADGPALVVNGCDALRAFGAGGGRGGEDVGVGAEGEDQAEGVDDEQDDAGAHGDALLVLVDVDVVQSFGGEVEDGGQEHGGDGDDEEAGVGLGGAP